MPKIIALNNKHNIHIRYVVRRAIQRRRMPPYCRFDKLLLLRFAYVCVRVAFYYFYYFSRASVLAYRAPIRIVARPTSKKANVNTELFLWWIPCGSYRCLYNSVITTECVRNRQSILIIINNFVIRFFSLNISSLSTYSRSRNMRN